jgi:hypothetical protein
MIENSMVVSTHSEATGGCGINCMKHQRSIIQKGRFREEKMIEHKYF